MTVDSQATPAPTGSQARKFRLSRLVLKELRETLRDRRTIITLLLMPLLVYPALSLVFKTFLLSNLTALPSGDPIVLQLAFSGDGTKEEVQLALNSVYRVIDTLERQQTPADGSPASDPARDQLVEFRKHEWFYVPPDSEYSIAQLVEMGRADAGVVFELGSRAPWEIGRVTVVERNQAISQTAAKYVNDWFARVNQFDIDQRLKLARLPTAPALQVTLQQVGSAEEPPAGASLASIVPLILVLMTITGAVYPAIDLTAGERERGTLETLMAAPVPRFGILFSKFLAVLTVAMLTAVLNIGGMFATVWAFQLDKQLGGGLFTLGVMLQILLLLILFAGFFSAILLVVTSFAKSFKEAQVYLIPVILLSLGPGLMAMAPGMELQGIYTVCPMINILLLARDVINNSVQFVPALFAVLSTLLYSYFAIRVAATIFGSDAILYADSGSLADMLQRPRTPHRVVPLPATLLCLTLLLPLNFASIGFLSRIPSDTPADLQLRFLLMGVFLFLSFMLVPILIARHQRTDLHTGFGWLMPRPVYLLAAIGLGISLWPIVMSLTAAWHDLYGVVAGEAARDEWKERLVETTAEYAQRIRMVSPWVIALCFSIVPAVCEEWFFRGMLLRSLLKRSKPVRAILVSAALFGAFHMISNSVVAIDRLIPTTLVGLILGYLAYKSDSILPGVVLHALHNAFVVFLAYYQKQLAQQSWFPGEDESIPLTWVAAGSILAALALGIVFVAKRGRTAQQPVADDSGSLARET